MGMRDRSAGAMRYSLSSLGGASGTWDRSTGCSGIGWGGTGSGRFGATGSGVGVACFGRTGSGDGEGTVSGSTGCKACNISPAVS